MDDGESALRLDDDNPWPGMAAYDEASQRFFHGREQDTVELLRLIRLAPFVTLYGKSGLGKSSMLQAGLFPQLRAARFLPVYLRLDYSESAAQLPLAQAALRLRQEIDAAGADASLPDQGENLWAYLQRRARPIWTADNYPLTPVLVFDQFEEVFSRGGSPEHVKTMLDSMADLVGDRLSAELAADRDAARRLNLQSPQYRVVLSFRSDFLADVESWEKRAYLPKRESLHLKALSRERAIEAVERAGATVLEPGVAAQIVDFVINRHSAATPGRATEVEPVLLTLCCYQLNSRRQRPAKIDAALLRSVGEDILEDFYREALAGMGPKVSVFIEDNLIQGRRYRSSYPRDEALASGALTQDELDRLTHRRLLRVDPQGEVPRIELIHDRLASVVRESRDARLAREQQQQRHEEAEQRAKSERERERLEQAERERTHVARWRNGLWVAVGLLLVAAGLLVRQMERANDEASRADAALRLVVEAQAVLSGAIDGDDVRAFQQLLAARQLQPGPGGVEGSLLDALTARQHLGRFAPVVIKDDSDPLAVAFSRDGRLLATGHRDGSVALRTLAEPQKVLARATGHVDRVQMVSFSNDGRLLLSAGNDGTVRQWRVDGGLAPKGEPLRAHEGAAYGAAYNRDATLIVSGGEDGNVCLWDAHSGDPSGEPVALNSGAVRGVAFSPDDKSIAAATSTPRPGSTTRASRLIMLDAATRGEKTSFPAHLGTTTSLAFSPSGRYVVTGGQDNTLRVRDPDSDPKQPTPNVRMRGHTDQADSVAFGPDEHIIASGSNDHTVRLWRADTGEPLGLPLKGHDGAVTSVAFSPDGRWLASGGEDKSLLLWLLDASWATPSGQQVVRDPARPRDDSDRGDVESVALSADGTQSVLRRSDRSLWLRNEQTRSQHELTDARSAARPALAPCDIARSATPEGGSTSTRDGSREPKSNPPAANPRGATSVAFSADGRSIVSGHGDGSLRRWIAKTGEPVGEPIAATTCAVTALAWSADGHRLAAASESQALLFDADSGALLQTLSLGHLGAVTALALSGDGSRLASAGADATLLLRDTHTGAGAESRFEGIRDVVTSLAFSSDGEYLVSGDAGGSVRVWERRNLRSLGRPLETRRGTVAALTFMPNGQRFLSSDRGGAVRPWPAPQAWPGLMCAKLEFNLSRNAWKEWVSRDIAYVCQCPGLPIERDDPESKLPRETCPAAR